jgi:hypothetical protein
MFKKFVNWLTGKKPETNSANPLDPAWPKPNPGHPGWPVPVPQAPYKVEPPVDTTPIPYVPANEPPKCGCGRSPTGYCVGLHKLSPEVWASHPNNPDMVGKIVAEPARPEKKPRKPAVKKPAVAKAPAEKKPRVKKST